MRSAVRCQCQFMGNLVYSDVKNVIQIFKIDGLNWNRCIEEMQEDQEMVYLKLEICMLGLV